MAADPLEDPERPSASSERGWGPGGETALYRTACEPGDQRETERGGERRKVWQKPEKRDERDEMDESRRSQLSVRLQLEGAVGSEGGK